jgi:hypothetical protein
MRRLDCHNAIKQVKGSYQTALQTIKALVAIVTEHPEYLYQHDLSLADLKSLAKELHDIYFTRMFACFESVLRNYWRTKVRNNKPRTEHLISSIAGKLGIPQDILDAAHEIREFRNFLIHEEQELKRRFTIEEASGYLNTYLARLPLQW